MSLAEGEPERAARLFGVAEAMREILRRPLPPVDRRPREKRVATLRALLGEPAFATAWAEGRRLSLEKAIALALQPAPRGGLT